MSTEPYLGSIVMFAGNFEPRGWAFCAGQILSISQNSALFAILGTTFGGNGIQTFALPDLRGRGPVGTGQGPGLSDIVLGEMAGTENVTLTAANMPSHNHPINCDNTGASSTARSTNRPASACRIGFSAWANFRVPGVESDWPAPIH